MAADSQTPPPEPTLIRALHLLRWPLALVALAALAFLVYWATLEKAGQTASATVDTAVALAKGFLTGNVTETFTSSIPEFDEKGSGNLELATYTVTETFQRTEEKRILWDQFSLGSTLTEVRVPVTYRYHLRLDDEWRVKVAGSTCVVFAPEIRPSLPPAIHTDRMEKRAESDWLRFGAADRLDELERSITPRLNQLSGDPQHLEAVRERSRRAVEKFVRDWLLSRGEWKIDRVNTILVIFPGEKTGDFPVVPELLLPDG